MTQIHEYIQKIIPCLVQRQEVLEKYHSKKGRKSDEEKREFEILIDHLNTELSTVLNIQFTQNPQTF